MKPFKTPIAILVSCMIAAFSMMPASSFGQNTDQNVTIDKATKDSLVLVWLEDLKSEGVNIDDDSIVVNKEVQRLMTDEKYRQLMYPKTYNWESVVYFIQTQDLKKAYWYLMNLYMSDSKNKEIALKSLLSYSKLFKMEKILVNIFYTYVLVDPEIGTIIDGQFKVTAPHVMEKKLNSLKELLYYLDKYKPKEEQSK